MYIHFSHTVFLKCASTIPLDELLYFFYLLMHEQRHIIENKDEMSAHEKNRIKYRKYRESHETAHFYHDYINTRHYVCMWQPTFVKNVKSAYNYFHQLPFFCSVLFC